MTRGRSFGQTPRRGRDQRPGQLHRLIHTKKQLEGSSHALEDEYTFQPSSPVGRPPDAADPRQEDEQDGDDTLDEGTDEEEDAPAAGAEDESEAAPQRSWTRRDLLRSRPAVVLVRLVGAGDDLEPRLTVAPRPRTADMLACLCDFLRDRFGPAGRSSFDENEWVELLGQRPAGLARRLALLGRLAVTGQHKFARVGGKYADDPSDLGLGHFARKFAALPDGTPFSIGLLTLDGRSGRKQASSEEPFDRLPLGLRLLALDGALRRERADGRVRKNEQFGALLGEMATALVGTVIPALPAESVTDFGEFLKRNGFGHLFPSALRRKRAAPEGR